MSKPSNIAEDGRITLTVKAVRSIRRRFWKKGEKQVHLAAEFGVTQGNINAIVHGRTWSHVPFEAGCGPEDHPVAA